MIGAQLVGDLSRAVLADQNGHVAVIRAFLDESGTHDGSPVVTVAGYFARHMTWKIFTRDWRRALKPDGINIYHATDAQALEGEFKGWTEDERDDLVKKLLPIIARQQMVGVAMSIVMRDYAEATKNRKWPHKIIGSPYATCFQWLIREILSSAQRVNTDEPIAIFHEQNNYKGEAERAYEYVKLRHDKNNNLAGFAFSTKDKYVPLQAADILAFEAGKAASNSGQKMRRPLTAMSRPHNRPIIKFYDKSNMMMLLDTITKFNESGT